MTSKFFMQLIGLHKMHKYVKGNLMHYKLRKKPMREAAISNCYQDNNNKQQQQ